MATLPIPIKTAAKTLIKTKRVYELAEADDGFRLLVMRRWPRGVRRDHIDAWERELGPSNELLDAYHKRRISWLEFSGNYLLEMQAKEPLLREIARMASSQTITLLCGCRDENACHRKLLKELLEQRRARP